MKKLNFSSKTEFSCCIFLKSLKLEHLLVFEMAHNQKNYKARDFRIKDPNMEQVDLQKQPLILKIN